MDYEARYIAKAKQVIRKAGLEGSVTVHCRSIYEESLNQELLTHDLAFDCAYFSGSFTLMPDPPGALTAVANMLKPDGPIYITQTFQKRNVPLLRFIKPWMKYITTIDFGQLTFEKDVEQMAAKAGMEIAESCLIPGSIDNQFQAARLLVVRKKKLAK